MQTSSNIMSLVLRAGLFLAALPWTEAHGYLTEPKSRNYLAREAGLEYCPHCLNGGTVAHVAANSINGAWPYPETTATSVRHGLCGDPAGAEQKYMEGGSLATGIITGTYTAGGVMRAKMTITAHHRGHVEFALCDKSRLADPNGPITQACLKPVAVVADPEADWSFVDPAYPSRMYLPPRCAGSKGDDDKFYSGPSSYTYEALLQLPSTPCPSCVLQWYYVTANTCNPPGYDKVAWPPICNGPGDEWWNSALSDCLSGSYPEEFWNCADISIVSSSGSSPAPQQPTQPTAPVVPPSLAQDEGVVPDAPADSTLVSNSCWKRHWSWPNDYCVLKADCEQWEMDVEYSGSWESCCAGHCKGTGALGPDNTQTSTASPAPVSQPPADTEPPSDQSSPSSSCWKRHWSWPNDYCALKTDCEQWEIDYDYSGSWEACCEGHCTGTGNTSPDNTNDSNNANIDNSSDNNDSDGSTNADNGSNNDNNNNNNNGDTVKRKRMVAYVENWKTCPTDAQLAEYTHIIFAFTVTYIWTPNGNNCNDQCMLYEPNGCGGESIEAFLARAHQHDVKVLLSLGGAGMGGLWDLSKNRCWDACWHMPSGLAVQTVEQVTHYGFDGVDVDYEYLVETTQQQNFVVDLTLELRRLLPSDALLTHAPMDYTLNKGAVYYQLLSEMGSSLDFLMPQYYNGHLNVISNDADIDKAMVHFGDLVDAMGGDESKVVFGFCLNDCGSFNAGKARGALLAGRLKRDFPKNGGVFFWASSGDQEAAWSRHVGQHQ